MLIFLLLTGLYANQSVLSSYQPQNGDLVFQMSLSQQSKAIEMATGSIYSHVGIVFYKNGQPMVLEAIGPVRYIPLVDWIHQGKDRHFVVKRLKAKTLDPATIAKMRKIGESYLGDPYDIHFMWSDEHIYCSELVWKIYQGAADIRIGKLRPWNSFKLDHPAVKALIKERFGNRHPTDEPTISPGDMFDSPLLEKVAEYPVQVN